MSDPSPKCPKCGDSVDSFSAAFGSGGGSRWMCMSQDCDYEAPWKAHGLKPIRQLIKEWSENTEDFDLMDEGFEPVKQELDDIQDCVEHCSRVEHRLDFLQGHLDKLAEQTEVIDEDILDSRGLLKQLKARIEHLAELAQSKMETAEPEYMPKEIDQDDRSFLGHRGDR